MVLAPSLSRQKPGTSNVSDCICQIALMGAAR